MACQTYHPPQFVGDCSVTAHSTAALLKNYLRLGALIFRSKGARSSSTTAIAPCEHDNPEARTVGKRNHILAAFPSRNSREIGLA